MPRDPNACVTTRAAAAEPLEGKLVLTRECLMLCTAKNEGALHGHREGMVLAYHREVNTYMSHTTVPRINPVDASVPGECSAIGSICRPQLVQPKKLNRCC